MLQWVFRIGLAALVASILLGATIAIIDPEGITERQAKLLDAIGKCLVAAWFAAGIPLWVSSVAHVWRTRHLQSRGKVGLWIFFLAALSLLAAYVYFPLFVRRRDGATLPS
jgi:hypothetical protein